jgi:hypothetical protein
MRWSKQSGQDSYDPGGIHAAVPGPTVGGAAGLPARTMYVPGSRRVDEGDIPQNATWPWTDVALELPTSPGAVGGAEPRLM